MKLCIFIATLCGFLITASANNDIQQAVLTLDQAIVMVLEHNRQFTIADYDSRAIAARIRQARLAPPDKVNITLEDFAGTGIASGVSGMQTTLSLARVLELGNKSSLRAELAQNEAYVLKDQQDTDRLDLLAETARRFLDVVVDQERLNIAEDAANITMLTQRTVEQRIEAGRTPIAERHRVAIDMAKNQLELDHVTHKLASSRLRLVTLWNEQEPGFTLAKADLFELGAITDINQLEQLLDRNPDLVRLASTQRLAEARIHLAQARRKPDLELSAGIRYLNSQNDAAFVVSASIPLGTSSRATSAIEEAQLLSNREPLVYEQQRLDLYTTLFEIHQELIHANDAVISLREKIIPMSGQMLLEYEKGFDAGRYSLLELLQARKILLDARLEAIEMATKFHRYQIEIDRLTGAEISERTLP